ncbi:MAG TPA: LacI family DNA-binding transcriptional regulator [Capsulimonadaceae bacterium]
MTKNVTQQDIASKLGVSQGLVGRVIAGDSATRVSAETRKRILDAASEMGYRPNLAALSMRQNRFYSIGVLAELPFIHPMAWQYVEGINKGLMDRGYTMSLIRLMDVDGGSGDGLSARAFQGRTLDGLIGVVNVPAVLRSKIEKLVPHCVWLNTEIRLPERCIHRDEAAAGRLAIEKLHEGGYHKVIYLRGGLGGHYSHRARLGAVQATAEKLGMAMNDTVIDSESGILETVVARTQPGSVVLVSDGYLVQHLAIAALHQGRRPGIDFAVACCDDGSGEWPGLSRVTFPRVAMGIAAAEMIVATTEQTGESPKSQLFCGEWVDGTTAPPPRGAHHPIRNWG